MIFGLGPAGTGKTYLAVAQAVSQLITGSVDRLILSRPAVEAGERLGFLPGDMKEKVDPYLRPLYDALYDMLPTEQVERRIASGEIEIAPLAFMRGRTLNDAFIILDEAQNTTPLQMKMFLTRFGMRSRMVICGDPHQVDLPDPTQVRTRRRGRPAREMSKASRSSASPPPTSSATRSSAASSRPMRAAARMMLEVAIEADEEWDSSRSWDAARPQRRRSGDRRERLPAACRRSDRPVEISVRLTGDDEVRALNADGAARTSRPTSCPSRWRKPTICTTQMLPDHELLLGDIVLARGVCEAEAADKGMSVEQHAAHLIVHGTLHLLGYDHLDDAEAADMEAREVRALARLGIANPYEVAA